MKPVEIVDSFVDLLESFEGTLVAVAGITLTLSIGWMLLHFNEVMAWLEAK